MHGKIPPPDEREIAEHTRDLLSVMTSSWLELLRQLVSAHDQVQLNDVLLPPKALDEKRYGILMRTLRPFAVSFDDAAEIMRFIAKDLFEYRDEQALPFGIHVRVTQREGTSPMRLLARTSPA